MGKTINIRPTSGVYATYKRLSYQPWTAIAEFVDNSTQSFYDHQDELSQQKYFKGLNIQIDYREDPVNGDSISITDDAYGMEWSDFQRAVVLDKPPKNTDGRNEFGMGLKTAACWFGSLWSVESTMYGSRNKYYTEVNTDELGKYKTEEIDVTEEIVHPKDHYTRIVIKNLNKKISGSRTVGKVKELLSSIYREDIRSGLVKIYYNGTLLQFKEAPVFKEIVNGQEKAWKKEICFNVLHEGKELTVKGFIAIRIPGSVKDGGFTLLRRGRVIVGGSEKNYRPSELFGDSNSYRWQRLYGELHMDNWPVTQAKDSFDWHNSGLEEAFIEALEPLVSEYGKKAESLRVRERIKTSDLFQSAINELSNSGVVETTSIEITTQPSNESNHLTDQNRDHAPMPTDSSTDHTVDEPEVITRDDDGVIVEGGNQADYKFKYKGTEYLFHINLELNNPSLQWLLVEMVSNSEYTRTINMRHTFFKPLIEKRDFLPILMRMAIALVLAEAESLLLSSDGRINASDIRIKMNEILENVRNGDNTHGH